MDAAGAAAAAVDFFISYTRDDRAWARWIAWQLDTAGYTTRLQDRDFRPGGDFVHEMQQATIQAARTIAVLSPSYLDSTFGEAEWRVAFAQDPTGEGGQLLPVRVAEVTPLGLLRTRIYIDLVGVDEPTARQRLLDGIRQDQPEGSRPRFPGTAPPEARAPRFPTALPPVWNVPYLRNPDFTGRTEMLAGLDYTLLDGQRAVLTHTQAITGLGGVGKTQTAVEYAYRHHPDYELVWWVVADPPARLRGDLAALAGPLGLPERTLAEQDLVVAAVRRWLEQHPGWLLIFDNAEDPALVAEVLPRGGGGRVLVTSRRTDWTGVAAPMPVEVFSPSEAIQFLLDRTGSTGQDDPAAAEQLANTLGHLPLALEQAGAYIAETGIFTLAGYLVAFATRSQELLARGQPRGYEHTVATTWNLTLEQLRQHAPAAVDLLTVAAFLGPDDLPITLLAEHTDVLPEPLAEIAADQLFLAETVGALRRYSLVKTIGDGLTAHRLLQTVGRGNLDPDAQGRWAGVAVRLLRAGFPDHGEDADSWPICQRLLPHAMAAAEHADRHHVPPWPVCAAISASCFTTLVICTAPKPSSSRRWRSARRRSAPPIPTWPLGEATSASCSTRWERPRRESTAAASLDCRPKHPWRQPSYDRPNSTTAWQASLAV